MAPGLESYLRSLIAENGRKGLLPSALRGFLGGCANLYDAGLEVYLAGEQMGLRRREALPIPIVSIGNLTVGGTGKTPMTQMLCRRLQLSGKRVAILSRGHGGESHDIRQVSDAEGRVLLTAEQAGDEPVLLAASLPGVPVFVGKDRRRSGREALRRFALDALVLDDGFQFWQLARDLDIVLLDARRPFDNGYPLPRGLLREPMRHLQRAGIIAVTRADVLEAQERAALRDKISSLAPAGDIHFARHAAIGLVPLGEPDAQIPLSALKGQRIFAVSGIAQPASFARTLSKATGARIVRHVVWNDHHRPDVRNIEAVQSAARDAGAEALVMTEKDAVKWPQEGRSGVPTYALRIEMCVEDEPRFLEAIVARLFRP